VDLLVYRLPVGTREISALLLLQRRDEPSAEVVWSRSATATLNLVVSGSPVRCAKDHRKDRKEDDRQNKSQAEGDLVPLHVEQLIFMIVEIILEAPSRQMNENGLQSRRLDMHVGNVWPDDFASESIFERSSPMSLTAIGLSLPC